MFRVCFVVVLTFFLTKFPYFVVACFRHLEAVTTKDVKDRISKTELYQDFRLVGRKVETAWVRGSVCV